VNNPYQFTGDEYDSDTQYDYSVARFEAGRWSRFMSPDPYMGSMDVSNPQSLNRYSYVLNNPTNNVDPLGLLTVPGPYCDFGDFSFAGAICEIFMLLPKDSLNGMPDLGSSHPAIKKKPQQSACLPAGVPGPTSAQCLAERPPIHCSNGMGSGGAGIGGGYNFDLGAGPVGISSTGGVGAGVFHNRAGGFTSGYSGGAFASGGVAAFAGSHLAGAPKQTSSTFGLGGYAGVGPNFFVTNGASAQQLAGPFTTVSVNVGIGVANFGMQVSSGGGIWQVSITPPIISFGFGAAGSVITTNTVATNTGCQP
jgi:RHS repeat-associated protein